MGQAGLLALETDGVREVRLGYITHRPFWRRGLAMEAAEACPRHAFEGLEAPRVLAPVPPEDETSRRLAEALGTTCGGRRAVRAGLEHIGYAPRGMPSPRRG